MVEAFEQSHWSTIPSDYRTPSPRHLHTVVVSGNSAFVFGGFYEEGTALNDLYEYNFGKCTENKI